MTCTTSAVRSLDPSIPFPLLCIHRVIQIQKPPSGRPQHNLTPTRTPTHSLPSPSRSSKLHSYTPTQHPNTIQPTNTTFSNWVSETDNAQIISQAKFAE
ncbi:hypothetical protein K469DRAFT_714150 [Zopfia rhizophila CBS 207.26]|uniref:Uncharacterized protein n=1 Tax=Zopfia rhizophila CBS 207.26 TaxID=1314779 RepID=A0A6A6DN83_9PEZI|nr:hypothetical protein K469DRAFT_714150 [Zopfia rhizophila CBS 207.26]